ncbi:DUF3040 domain-containing protein [Actinoplanes sp. Pm04-4]|uniref:DUF3040 domain-containing protein n=1 Tax=Paractinoplanes pyxinae TaxID=2997416 RepID=A0ABT4BGP8_9ACTN|nr:DUF3040 domain-containing protein [Actinoplanes pyxinae]MCY1145715.1 DUF3040 domain-containing protein [Actinoplanes pyxinae]
MLDDVERRRLAEIDARLTAADPRLARTLSRHRRWPRSRAASIIICVLAVMSAVLVGALASGPPAAIAGGLTIAAVLAGLWLQARLGSVPRIMRGDHG